MKNPIFRPKKFFTKKHKYENTATIMFNESAFGSTDESYEFFAQTVTFDIDFLNI